MDTDRLDICQHELELQRLRMAMEQQSAKDDVDERKMLIQWSTLITNMVYTEF